MKSAIYAGQVFHRRFRPRAHTLRYSMFQCLFDLDEIDRIGERCRLFSRNGWNLFSFHDRDYGDRSGEPLRPQIEALMRRTGQEPDGGPIRLLTMPRMLGHVFNPLSVWFCHRRDGSLATIIYEVTNTFKERHSYVIPVADGDRAAPLVHQACDKAFYVSPFMDIDMRYDFTVEPPMEKTRVVVAGADGAGPLIIAAFHGARREVSDGALAAAFLRHPLLTLKVVAGIHVEALWLFLKRIGIRRHRPAGGDGKDGYSIVAVQQAVAA
ncbi:DUF1365 domain-containing protein [Rhizorhabdus dicambivorans]|uniref:DUF1365 domain-containing protein n=1 Tax=Rhizorhabdus dicambivorans TaxID=1850238 RepID=A0A2A4G063_9SPHN|nr:DUF1365 domain-containing protein [Rhizorhabdus dicambivorans]ATE64841.1 DUF1365 domain-containing protein [Rhizorhabdus dicambivorans]PCE44115.1 DUF1365 domain-containing protein [Rhizorhabdus dicambivorans]